MPAAPPPMTPTRSSSTLVLPMAFLGGRELRGVRSWLQIGKWASYTPCVTPWPIAESGFSSALIGKYSQSNSYYWWKLTNHRLGLVQIVMCQAELEMSCKDTKRCNLLRQCEGGDLKKAVHDSDVY